MFFCIIFSDKNPIGWILVGCMCLWAIKKRSEGGFSKRGIKGMTKKQLRETVEYLVESLEAAEKKNRRLNAQVNIIERRLNKQG